MQGFIRGGFLRGGPFRLPAFKKLLAPEVVDHVENQMDSHASNDYHEVRKRGVGPYGPPCQTGLGRLVERFAESS